MIRSSPLPPTLRATRSSSCAPRPSGPTSAPRRRKSRAHAGCRRRCSTNSMRAGLFRLLLPRSSNGIETDPMTFFHVIETIARADASTAWCLSQAGGCAMSAAYLDLPVAHAVFGNDPRAVLAWGPGPRSRRSNARAATGSPASGPSRPAAGTPPGSAPIARSPRPTARRGWMPAARSRSAPCWCAPRTCNGPTSGTRSACAAPPATSSR